VFFKPAPQGPAFFMGGRGAKTADFMFQLIKDGWENLIFQQKAKTIGFNAD